MRISAILIMEALVCTSGAAQVESGMTDTLGIITGADDLIEQTTQSENSNILDELGVNEGDQVSHLNVRSRWETKLQPAAGFREGNYAGSRLHSYQKILLQPGTKWQAGVLFEKDPGEGKWNDFTSFHLSIHNVGIVSRCIAGDFLMESGQGIAMWRGNDYTKGGDVIRPLVRKERNLVPYLSSNEQNFLRGVAVSSDIGPVSVTLFSSWKKLSSVLDGDGSVVSISSSGEFRTVAEISRRNNLSENLFGGKLSCHIPVIFRGGMTILESRFDRRLNLAASRLSGQRFSAVSLDYDLRIGEMATNGEWVISNHTAGGIGSLLVSPVPAARCILSYRRYPSGLFSIHGLGFGDGSATSNETGLYIGCDVEPAKRIRCSLFFDQFSSPLPTGSSYLPSSGHEMLCTFRTVPFKHGVVELQYRYKRTRVHHAPQTAGPGISDDDLSRSVCRVEIKHDLNPRVMLAGRWEYHENHLRLDDNPSYGRLVYAEARIQPSNMIEMSYRLIFFSTDSYDTRISEFERSLDGAVSIPAVFGDGIKWYVLLKLRPCAALSVGVKYSDLFRNDTRRIGSGLEELPGNHDNRVGFQIDLRL